MQLPTRYPVDPRNGLQIDRRDNIDYIPLQIWEFTTKHEALRKARRLSTMHDCTKAATIIARNNENNYMVEGTMSHRYNIAAFGRQPYLVTNHYSRLFYNGREIDLPISIARWTERTNWPASRDTELTTEDWEFIVVYK